MSCSRKINNGQKGVSVFLAVMILTIILSVALGISTISVFQTKMIKGMNDSVTSFYAADTGMELVLYRDKRCRLVGCGSLPWACLDVLDCDNGLPAGSLSGNLGSATYWVNFNAGADTISSEGTYQETKRAVRVQR